MRKNIFMIGLCLCLMACSSSKPSNFYNIVSVKNFDVKSKINKKLNIGIKPVTIPNYLTRPQIITNKSDIEFNISEINRWLEPLQYSIQRTLAEDIGQYIPTSIVKTVGIADKENYDYTIQVEINKLNSNFDTGKASLSAFYNIENGRNTIIKKQVNFTKDFTIEGKKDYSKLTIVYSELIDELSVDILNTIIK